MDVSRCGVWGLVVVLAACAPTARYPPLSASFSAWLDRSPVTKKVCVLPFTNQTDKPGLGESVRRSVYSHLSVRKFHDVELTEIDTTLRALPEEWQTLSSQVLGRRLGCNGLVYGEVLDTTRLYLAVYSRLILRGAIRLVDAESGSPLVEASYTTKIHAGGVPFSPLGVVPASIIALHNVLDDQIEKAVHDLGRHLVEFVPDMAMTVASARPTSELPAQAMTRAAASKSYYRLQVASFLDRIEAERAVRSLQRQGYHPSVVEVKNLEQSWHRVLIGPFSSIKEAQETKGRIQETLSFTPLITQIDKN